MNKLYPENCIQDIASAIKEKTGDNSLMTVSEMAGKISNIKSDESRKIVPASWKNITSDTSYVFWENLKSGGCGWMTCGGANPTVTKIVENDIGKNLIKIKTNNYYNKNNQTNYYYSYYYNTDIYGSSYNKGYLMYDSCKVRNLAFLQGDSVGAVCEPSGISNMASKSVYPFEVVVFTQWSQPGYVFSTDYGPTRAIVCIHSTPPSITAYNINLAKDIPIYVPDDAINTFKSATNWSAHPNYRPLSEFDMWDDDY